MGNQTDIETVGPFIDAIFDRMRTPSQGDALVILRQRGMDEVMAMLACSGTQCTLATWNTDGCTRTCSIDAEECEELLNGIRTDELMSVGAVFAEDIVDGECYLAKHVRSGEVRKSVLGNPRLCKSEALKAMARRLDSFLEMASSKAVRAAARG